MIAWRLVPERRGESREQAFSGMGSYLYGQRWNLPGQRIVYLAEHLSLAALEVIVHAATYRELGEYRAFRIEFPDDQIETLERDTLPANWKRPEPARGTQELGSDWASQGRSLLLRVPSAVVPQEHNYLLNVEHPDYTDLEVEGPLPFRFDPRLEEFNLPA